MFDRVTVFTASPAATFLALLLELLLSLGVCKAKIELDAVVIGCDTVEVLDDSFSNVPTLEAGFDISNGDDEQLTGSIPSKANFLADTRWAVTADLGGNCVVW